MIQEYPRPLRSVAFVADPPSVVVVEEVLGGWQDDPVANATVFNLDGTERLKLTPPPLPRGEPNRGFDQCYESRGGLVVAVYDTYHRGLIWGSADLTTGELGPTNPHR